MHLLKVLGLFVAVAAVTEAYLVDIYKIQLGKTCSNMRYVRTHTFTGKYFKDCVKTCVSKGCELMYIQYIREGATFYCYGIKTSCKVTGGATGTIKDAIVDLRPHCQFSDDVDDKVAVIDEKTFVKDKCVCSPTNYLSKNKKTCENPCLRLNCGSHGKCVTDEKRTASCQCDKHSKLKGGTCVWACTGNTCPSSTSCEAISKEDYRCNCKDKKLVYFPKELKCANPCVGVKCGTGVQCVPISTKKHVCDCEPGHVYYQAQKKCISFDSLFTTALEAFRHGGDSIKTFMDSVTDKQLNKLLQIRCELGRQQKSNNADAECSILLIARQFGLIKAFPKQLIRKDGRLIVSPEYKEVGLKSYIEKMKEDLREKSDMIDIKLDIKKVVKSNNGIKKYFSKLADYDRKIAAADNGYITSEIKRMTKGASELSRTLTPRIRRVLYSALWRSLAEVAERTGELVARGLNCFNPAAVVFGTCDPVEIKESLEQLTAVLARVAKIRSLGPLLTEFLGEIKKIFSGFQANAAQYNKMKEVMKAMSDPHKVDSMSNEFLELYNAYTPEVTEQQLQGMLAKLTLIAETACELRDTSSGMAALSSQAKQNINLAKDDCMHIPVDLEKFKSYQEGLYSFQFDLVDTLSSQVRGNIAMKFAEGMSAGNVNIHNLIVGLGFDTIRLQKIAHIYCNFVEYKRGGYRPSVCKNSFFTADILNQLTSINVGKYQYEVNYVATLPVKPGKDTPVYLDMKQLLAGSQVSFQLPDNNMDWLITNNWIYNTNEMNRAMSVLAMEIVLPVFNRCRYSTEVSVISGRVNRLTSGSRISYMIPEYPLRFRYTTNNDPACVFVEKRGDICVTSKGVLPLTENEINTAAPYLFDNFKVQLTRKGLSGRCKAYADKLLNGLSSVKVHLRVGVNAYDRNNENESSWLK